MNEVTVSLPTPSAVTLHESFSQLQVSPTNSSPTRPLQPVYLYKRSADVAGVNPQREGSGESSKRKRDLQSIRDGGVPPNHNSWDGHASGSASGSGSGSGSGSRSGGDDHQMSAGSSSHASRTGSESGSRQSGSQHGSSSTPPTSTTDSDGQRCFTTGRSPDKLTSINTSPLNVPRPLPRHRSSESNPSGTGRTTYVNPSPMMSSNFTYPPPSSSSFGSTSFSSTGYDPTFGQQYNLNNTTSAPPAYTIVTFGAGTMSKQLDAATARSPYGSFFVPTSAFPVGAGQFLLGGFGFLGRKHGLAVDNVVEAEVVLADGRIVWVGEHGMVAGDWAKGEDPEEFWWGLRGAGPALGVVTRYRAKAYHVPSVYAGNFI